MQIAVGTKVVIAQLWPHACSVIETLHAWQIVGVVRSTPTDKGRQKVEFTPGVKGHE